jgi:photosystem II stability/assembly factor-like uncharacterized protein
MKNLFRYGLILLAVAYSYSAKSQTWLMNIKSKKTENFYVYQKAFNEYWKNKIVDKEEEENNCEEGGWQQFKRWENFIEPRVYPSGKFFKSTVLWDEWQKFQSQKKESAKNANWELLGPSVVPSDGGGNGRVNCICFHPTDPNIFWIGAPNGGIWKTINGGSSWISLNANLLTNISIADIAVDPNNTNILYIATGDGYGYEVEGMFWGGTYSAGVLKSTDGGVTWNPTGLSSSQAQNDIIQRLVVCHSNTQVLLASKRDGLWRSADGGTTWTAVMGAHFYDIKFNVLNDSIIYAASANEIYKSTNLGLTWTPITSGLNPGGGRISLAVTQANAQVIYAFCNGSSGDAFYKSSNGGLTFQPKTSPDGAGSFYGYYDMVLAASPTNENTVYTGGLDVIKSTDGGTSWAAAANWAGWPGPNYVHADNHDIEFLPGSGTTVFSCNDGGIFKTTNGSTSWSDISGGLAISQFYRMGCSATDPNLIYTGAQDNGTNRYDGINWTQVYGADGMEALVDYTNTNNVYVSYQGGAIQKSTDGGNTFTDISPSYGAWTTPFIIHPTNSQILFAGYEDVYKTTNGGTSWNTISSGLGGGSTLRTLVISQSNPNYIYTGTLGNLYRTTNGGTNWSDISSGLPVASAAITGIAISDYDPQLIWVTFAGYSDGEKVYTSTDGGSTWTNVSGTLANVPVDCIVYQNSSSDALYIGTDFGVFYTDNTMNDWVSYSTGLPNVIVDELEIQYDASKIRAATYGRGLWESDLNSTVLYNLDAGVYALISIPTTSCDSIITPVVRIKNFGTDTLTSLTLSYHLDGGSNSTYPWSGSLANNAYVNITLPAMNIPAGNHTFTAFTSNPNGLTDGNTTNDSKTISFTIVGAGQALPLTEGFEGVIFPPSNWTSSAWEKTTLAGGFGNSSSSTLIDFYSMSPGQIGNLITDFSDFNSISTPIYLSFDVAYARYDNVFSDTLRVKISTDCGTTWTTVWTKGDSDLATAPDMTSVFVPTAAQWRTETIDLSSYASMDKVKVLFEGQSGYGNDLYVDNINIYNALGITGNSINTNSVKIYPNPSNGEFSIDLKDMDNTNVAISIYDAMGALITKSSVVTDGTEQHFSFDLSGHAKGLYLIKIATDKTTVNRIIAII